MFRRRRKSRKAQEEEQLPDRPESQSGGSIGGIALSVEATLLEVNRPLEYETAYEHSDELPSAPVRNNCGFCVGFCVGFCTK